MQTLDIKAVQIRSPVVVETLRADVWSMASGELEAGAFVLRFRTPVLGPTNVEGFSRVLRVVWSYAPVDSDAMPTASDSNAMGQFEDRLCAAFEHDAHAYLAAVLTFDGARQWVFFTSDVPECGRRLHQMPQEVEPYPIKLDAFDDPEWSYLHDTILRNVNQDV